MAPSDPDSTQDPGVHEGAWVNDLADGAQQGEQQAGDPMDDFKSGLKIMGDLSLSLGKYADKIDNYLQHRARLELNTPVNYPLAGSGTFPATGNLVIGLGGPDKGRLWEVTNLVVGGTDLNVTAAGTAGVYVSSVNPGQGSGGITQAADYASGLPRVAFYGTRQLVVQANEYLWVVIFGG